MPELSIQSPPFQAALVPWLSAPRWSVAFSGGLDSTVLLHLLREYRDRFSPATRIRALHVHHGLQPQAEAWLQHCSSECSALGLDFAGHRVAVAASEASREQAARRARYAVFEQELGAGEPLFMAHHLNDQAETIFLRLLRGSGARGLTGMPARRKLGDGELVRPLLACTREQLQDYARSRKLRWVEDPSNADAAADRNFLRHQVLPLLAGRWPGYRTSIGRAAENLATELAALDSLLPPLQPRSSPLGDRGLALASLVPQEVGVLQLRRWLRQMDLPPPDSRPTTEFLRHLHSGSETSRARLDCGRYVLQRYRDAIYRLPEPVPAPDRGAELILAPGEALTLPGGGRLSLVATDREGLQIAAQERLRVRFRAGGERCTPLGQDGSRPLKKLLQEAGIPPWWRERVPLLYLDGEMLAVGDLWLNCGSRLRSGAADGESRWIPRWQRN